MTAATATAPTVQVYPSLSYTHKTQALEYSDLHSLPPFRNVWSLCLSVDVDVEQCRLGLESFVEQAYSAETAACYKRN